MQGIISMGKFIDLTGKIYGKLLVVSRAENQGQYTAWNCLCECGNKKISQGINLKRGDAKSCGCLSVAKDITGKKFGRLTVLSRSKNKGNQPMWKCLCQCGNQKDITGGSLVSGTTKSCGCYKTELRTTHGMTGTPEYGTWAYIIQRCTNPKASNYERYGGRGITVCERWNKFENFYEDMGERPEGLSIDRIDNNKGYSPENCKWSTASEQSINQRTSIANTSGRKGVYPTPAGRWYARISYQCKVYQLGHHDTFEQACEARDKGEIKYYGKILPKY